MNIRFGLDSSWNLVYVEQEPQPSEVFCFYCKTELLARKGRFMADSRYVHVGRGCHAANRVGMVVDLPLYDDFTLGLTGEEVEMLKSGMFFNKPDVDWNTTVRVRDRLIAEGMLVYGPQGHEVTNKGLIPIGALPFLEFSYEQDRLIRQRYEDLQAAVDCAGGEEERQLVLADLNLYRAQWQHVLTTTLLFIDIQHDEGHIYKVSVVEGSVDDYAARLERDLRPLFGRVQVTVLCALAHQGVFEHYVRYWCGNQAGFVVVAGCFVVDSPDDIVAELKKLGNRALDGLEAEILGGQWFVRGAVNTVTVKVDGSSLRSPHERVVEMKEYHITCRQCGEDVTLWRYPGRPPTLCSDECKRQYRREQDREKTRERVRRYRARRRAANRETE